MFVLLQSCISLFSTQMKLEMFIFYDGIYQKTCKASKRKHTNVKIKIGGKKRASKLSNISNEKKLNLWRENRRVYFQIIINNNFSRLVFFLLEENEIGYKYVCFGKRTVMVLRVLMHSCIASMDISTNETYWNLNNFFFVSFQQRKRNERMLDMECNKMKTNVLYLGFFFCMGK